MSNLHRGHSIDAPYQVSVHLAKRFQRRRFLKIGQSETSIYGMSSMKMLISSRSVSKHGHHMQFLFLIGRFLKKSSPLKLFSHMNQNLLTVYLFIGKHVTKYWVINYLRKRFTYYLCQGHIRHYTAPNE
jgi:hypothetical protein